MFVENLSVLFFFLPPVIIIVTWIVEVSYHRGLLNVSKAFLSVF